MTDIIGPADAPNFTTSRPVDDRTIGATDTWMKDCSGPTANDGTKVKAAWLNAVIGQFRSLLRGNGNTGAGPSVVAEDNADDMALRAVQHLIQRGQTVYGVDSGAADTLTVSLSPPLAEYKAGLRLLVKITTANTGTATLNVNGLGAKTIKRADGFDLSSGDLKPDQIIGLIYDGTVFRFAGSARSEMSQLVMSPMTTVKFTTPGSTNFTVPDGVTSILARVWGAGGGGGYANGGTDRAPSGGSSGAYAERRFVVAPGDNVAIVVGAGGSGGSASPAQAGQPGLASSVTVDGVTMTANGGGGGLNATVANMVSNAPAGGSHTNADFGIRGEDGHIGISVGVGSVASGGSGAAAPLGGGETPGGRGNPGVGVAPGGGGGATSDSGIAGATGARGEVHIVYATPGV